MTASNDVRLEYLPQPPWHRRRSVRQLAAWVVVAGALTCVILWGPRAWRRGRILYYQHLCLTFSAPPDAVVFEPEPARAALLLRQNRGLQYWGKAPAPEYAVAPDPPCLRGLTSLLPPGLSTRSAVAFMHELRNQKGDRRLVVIAPPSDPAMIWYSMAPLTGPLGQVQTGTNYMGSCYGQTILNAKSPRLRIFAGQIDPSDPSHFTFAYESGQGKGTIDGWLTDACDLKVQVRDGPAVTEPKPVPLEIHVGGPVVPPMFGGPSQDLIDDRGP